MIAKVIWIAAGGALGSVLRYLVGLLVSGKFPFSTLIVNIIGSFLIGVLISNLGSNTTTYYLGVIGFCGGFTTFSAFSLETLKLFNNGQSLLAFLYILLSVTICILAVFLGTKIKLT